MSFRENGRIRHNREESSRDENETRLADVTWGWEIKRKREKKIPNIV